MKNILLMYEDGSFIVMTMQEYMSSKNVKGDVEILLSPSSSLSDKKYCVRVPSQSTIFWKNLSEFSEETRSLLVLYEI